MPNIHTDLSIVQISVAPSPATSGLSLGVTDANAALLPDVYPWWATVKPSGAVPTRANSEIIKVTAGVSLAGTTTYTIERAKGIPVTTARTIIVGDDIFESHTAQKQIDTEIGKVSIVSNEVPSGTVNGTNVTFTLVSSPVTGTLQIFRDGQLLVGGGADYTLTGNSIAFVTAPVTGSVLLAFYQSIISTSGNADTLDGVHLSTLTDIALSGWYSISDAWAYATADAPTFTITVPSGAASKYTVGMRVRLTQTTVKYFIITTIADTVLTVYGGTDYTLTSAAISAISVSNVKAPLGFPMSPTKWTVEFADNVLRDSGAPTPNVYYNVGSSLLTVPIGSWNLSYQLALCYTTSATVQIEGYCGLGTTNNTNTLTYMGGAYAGYGTGVSNSQTTIHRESNIVLTSKTTYYLNANCVTGGASVSHIYYRGDVAGTIIRAVCSYL